MKEDSRMMPKHVTMMKALPSPSEWAQGMRPCNEGGRDL
jgi:hypothetical protein